MLVLAPDFESGQRGFESHRKSVPCFGSSEQISGCTPQLFGRVMDGCFSPMEYMLRVLHAERYAKIAA